MTATDTIRAMLDERGVEWMPSVWSAKDETFYKVGEVGFLATEMSSGRMKVGIEGYLTPEQAIEATLGRGECERLQDENERLRSCLSDSAENAKQIMHEAHVQEAENDKLRELVRFMWLADYAGHFSTLPELQEHQAVVWHRMCELGVEV